MKIILEHSAFRIWWDLLIVLLILTTAVIVPYDLAFHAGALGSVPWIILCIDAVFWIDIALNFRTSFRRRGVDITDRIEIRKQYTGGWLTVDLVSNLPVDLLFIGMSTTLVAGMPIVLLLRCNRLLRFARLYVVFRRWERQSWTNSGLLRIGKYALTITALLHALACGWFLLARAGGFVRDSWVVREGIEHADTGTQYVRSIYWTVTTMTTVGYGDITPRLNAEFLFAAAVMLIGATMYAFMIGNIAVLVGSIDAVRSRFWNRFDALSQTLRSRQVAPQLIDRIKDYYEYVWERHKGILRADFLEDLPGPLHLDVMHHLAEELLGNVPLLRFCSIPLRNELLVALKPQTHAPGTYLVHAGEIGREIFFITQGRACIVVGEERRVHGTLEAGDSFGLFAVALGEKRTASVRADTFCEVFVLHKDDFMRIKTEYLEFTEVLNSVAAERTEHITALLIEGIIL